jgi:hypothetical protein
MLLFFFQEEGCNGRSNYKPNYASSRLHKLKEEEKRQVVLPIIKTVSGSTTTITGAITTKTGSTTTFLEQQQPLLE